MPSAHRNQAKSNKAQTVAIDASWQFATAVLKHLTGEIRIEEHRGSQVPVYDEPADEQESPKILLGDSFSRSWHGTTFDGQEHDLTLHVWTIEGGSLGSKKISSQIINRLHNADFSIPGHALVDLQFESSETRYRRDKQQYHCRLAFRGLTVSD